MKKLLFVGLAIGLPMAVATLASPPGVLVAGWPALTALALAAFSIQWLAFVPARIFETERFYDFIGSLTYIALTLAALGVTESLSPEQALIAAMVVIWAGRLGSFLFRRIHAVGGDRRFDHIKISSARFFVAWTLQGAWAVMTSCAALTAILSDAQPSVGTVFFIGAGLWAVGFAIEVIADRQKSQFRADSANDGKFIDTGLWARSRHPNYLGEMLLWVGIAVMAVPYVSGSQWVVALSPVFVYGLLTRISGIPTLARRGLELWGDDPAYRAYLENTPRLLPRLF